MGIESVVDSGASELSPEPADEDVVVDEFDQGIIAVLGNVADEDAPSRDLLDEPAHMTVGVRSALPFPTN